MSRRKLEETYDAKTLKFAARYIRKYCENNAVLATNMLDKFAKRIEAHSRAKDKRALCANPCSTWAPVCGRSCFHTSTTDKVQTCRGWLPYRATCGNQCCLTEGWGSK